MASAAREMPPPHATAPDDVSTDATVASFAGARVLERGELLAAAVRFPRPSRLRVPLSPARRRMATGLRTLGLETVGDLIEHLPVDSRTARTIAALGPSEQATVAVEVRSIAARPVRRRRMRPLVEATVFDATATMRATFFNQPWLVERYPPGTRLLLHGKADGRGGFRVSHHAPADAVDADDVPAAPEGATVAHYPAAEGITSTEILTLVRGVRDTFADVPEPLPARIRVEEGLPRREDALTAMHFPRERSDLETGRRRLAFEELLVTQLAFMRRRARRLEQSGARPLDGPAGRSERWLREGLPFEPTGDQLRAIATIEAELRSARPMQRLLMGEVGSGKTVVALHAMLRAVDHGCQAALMAPTETLAEQHFATIQRLLGAEPVSMALLTGSTPAARRRDILGKLASGELSLLVGTHALIEPDVRFAALAVAVIDEQHRFGVRQREALLDRGGGRSIHTLHMTATPIPRTLALARFGDLDATVLRELPLGRRPIETRVIEGEAARAQAYEELRQELRAGRQAYVVCPLIDEASPPADGGAEQEMRAATAELARLAEGELRGFSLGLLHGGMRPREKQQAMGEFADGSAQVLVATTVIEVGIDVPNATVMLIENAERFGISQLHQLRGGVGGGEHAGWCYLAGTRSAVSSGGVAAVARHNDGFRLAEIDLALRKEGELIGTRQSGLGQFRIARLPEDAQLLERARRAAEEVASADPQLRRPEHALLADALVELLGEEELDPIPA